MSFDITGQMCQFKNIQSTWRYEEPLSILQKTISKPRKQLFETKYVAPMKLVPAQDATEMTQSKGITQRNIWIWHTLRLLEECIAVKFQLESVLESNLTGYDTAFARLSDMTPHQHDKFLKSIWVMSR